ncbi:hypothetical protein Dxin01_03434 [Deinococcus xinjiangensis]|uniref:HigA2-like helix-turn-helix domain-containing protein n=1 Tax=Deinococcus xinjiangensis TaxID=457454 RepID=A0ABP9VEM1_9DEIO
MSEPRSEKVTRSSGNVFADLNLPNPQETLVKARLASLIHDAITAAGWTQAQAAEALGLKQPDVSKLTRGILGGFSVERLLDLLTRLNGEVTITVSGLGGTPEAVSLPWGKAAI